MSGPSKQEWHPPSEPSGGLGEPPRAYRERRIQLRHPVDLHAKVRGRNQLPTNCRVLNLCNGGVLLDTPATEPELPFLAGEHVDLHFDLPDTQSMDPVQAVIEVTHRVDRGIGARFIRLAGEGRSRLVRFVSENAASMQHLGVDFAANPRRAQGREVLQEVSRQHLGGLLDSLLETLVEDLWAYGERATNDADRLRLTGEIGRLARAIQEENVPQKIQRELLDALGRLGQAGAAGATVAAAPAKTDPPADGLQLVDQDEFEIWLAKTEFANRLEQQLHDPLKALRTQISALFQESLFPAEPQALAELIEHTLRELGIGKELQKLSMQIVANHLARNLGAFYREILRVWIASGLEECEPSPERAELSSSPSASENPPFATAGNGTPDAPAATPDQTARTATYAAIPPAATQAAAIPQSAAAHLAGTLPAHPVVTGQRLAELLSRLPANVQIPAADPLPRLRELLAQWIQPQQDALHTAAPPALSPQIVERIEVAGRLLSHMLTDPVTPQRVKSLIAPLSNRFLAMALTEPGVMANVSHPLIGLINHLEHFALFLLNQDADRGDLRHAFEEVVDKLATADAQDPAALQSLSQQLKTLESHAGREYQANVANWINVCEAKERERLAHEQVREQLNGALAGRRMHRVIDELLQSGWRSLLESLCANGGSAGPRWSRSWNLLLNLHRRCGGERAAHDEDALALDSVALEPLLAEIRDGLSYIGSDAMLCDELLKRIETAVHRDRAALHRDDDFLIFAPLAPAPASEPDTLPPNLSEADWERALAWVDALPLGALLWMQSKDESRALRLIWRNESGSRLAIADTLGKKVKVLRRSRLAETFARNQTHTETSAATRAVARATDAALIEMQERLVYHETHDTLTGLANQRRLLGSLTQLLLTARDSAQLYALAFLELDRYDMLTGTFGYTASERILVAIARLLESVIADAVCLAYLGGCRFGLLIPAIDRDHAQEIGEAIRVGLTMMPCDLPGKTFRLTGSLGMVMLTGDTTSPEQLISAASVACLASRREGGDQIIVFSEDNEIITRQLEHQRGLAQVEEVIRSGRHRLRYQRIVPIDDTAELMPHCEILLSIYDDQNLPLPLQPFIVAAEAFNLMREVDRQVIDATFQWIAVHLDEARAIGGVAINLSGQSLDDPNLLTFIQTHLARFQVPVELVSFEVTETAAILNLEQAAIILGAIKALGCQVALDDFGAGMSSYSYLKQLPVDYVKIDGSFVKDILISPEDRKIVKSFNEIAHFMGKKTIAEYVENLEILELLRDLGVDYAQGYAIEKPQFLDDLSSGASLS